MTGNFFVSQANSATVMVQNLCFTSTIPGSRTVTQLGLMHEIMGKVSLKFIFCRYSEAATCAGSSHIVLYKHNLL